VSTTSGRDDVVGARARELGFAGLDDLLRAKADVPNRVLGELLGLSVDQARALRLRSGFASPGRWVNHVPASRKHRARLTAADLAAVPVGEQPTRGEESLCLECGGWFRTRGMPQHLATKHRTSLEAYRVAHGLDPHAARAHELGYSGIEDMLRATAHLNGPDLAALLGTDLRGARELRGRHGMRTPRGRTAVPALSPPELDALPAGVQPEADGKLLCRECGRWYRGLAQHLPHKHDLTPDQYRERHGLAVDCCLQSTDLHEKRARSGRARFDSDAEWRERFLASAAGLARPGQLAAAHAGRRRSAARPGGRVSLLESGQRLSRVLPQRNRDDFERRARELSYDSVEEMLRATAHLSGADLGALLGVARHRVYDLRSRHGFDQGARPRAPRVGSAPPAALPAPRVGEDRRECLECGGLFAFVGMHVSAAHGLRPAEYRARHGISAEVALHPFAS
jgi:predicted transcriptional regulator